LKYLLASIHDVTPAYTNEIKAIMQLYEQYEIKKYTLFIVPRWYGRWKIERDQNFQESIREKVYQGAEVVLHGFTHQEREGLKGAWFLRRLFAKGEAELFGLSYSQAREIIQAGLEVFRKVKLEPKGFVPPAWLSSHEVDLAIKDSGFMFTESLLWLKSLSKEYKTFSPLLSYSSRSVLISLITTYWSLLMEEIGRFRKVVRLAIHPQDMKSRLLKKLIPWQLEILLKDRVPITYSEYFRIKQREKKSG
jgi:hypothetical protein